MCSSFGLGAMRVAQSVQFDLPNVPVVEGRSSAGEILSLSDQAHGSLLSFRRMRPCQGIGSQDG